MTGGRITEGDVLPAIDPWSATLIRVCGAAVLTWLMLPAFQAVGTTVRAFSDPVLRRFALAAAFIGMVVGVWGSLVTLRYAPSGVGAALMSLSPIFMIPLSRLAFGERHSARAVVGTLVATVGVILLLAR
jgi:drug/metabolite transporter (DMT)-like permease